jgi:uncharacterized membrane protein
MKSTNLPFGTTTTVAAGALFAALVAAITLLFQIPIPATQGYFNLGETIIYAATLVLNPLVGAFAGGGAAISDVLSGYGVYAPGTLFIKATEGFTVGWLNNKLKQKMNTTLSAVISVLAGGSIMVVGYFLYEIPIKGVAAAAFEIPINGVQMLVGLLIAVPIMHAVLRVFPQLKSQM